MLEEMIKKLAEGIKINNFIIYAKKISKGRFLEEENLDLYIKREKLENHLLYVKVFYGRKPYYKPWIEIFGINAQINLGEEIINYFDSIFEYELLSFFSNFLDKGGKIFIEYYADEETRKQLAAGFPPSVTRLGYKLFNLGFTYFKDWYFPEGFMEGEQKLQAEKPINDEEKKRQIKQIKYETKEFLEKVSSLNKYESYIIKSIERAKIILSKKINDN
ncbi:MAG: DUF1122 family protein [Nitrososphaerota archaeon]